MNREEVRDQLLVPVLQWTKLGRDFNKGLLAAGEVITQRSYGLLRGHTSAEGHDWQEIRLMSEEKVTVPLESMVAMAKVFPGEVIKFWSSAGEALLACAGSRGGDEFRDKQAQEALLAAALVWAQLAASAATIADAGFAPLLRQVRNNAERLG